MTRRKRTYNKPVIKPIKTSCAVDLYSKRPTRLYVGAREEQNHNNNCLITFWTVKEAGSRRFMTSRVHGQSADVVERYYYYYY